VTKTSRWSQLSDRSRKVILLAAGAEGLLKIAALFDLWRRPAAEVRGSKAGWAAAIVVINSAGIVPLGYFLRGRRTQP
jgi:hypothetical protein